MPKYWLTTQWPPLRSERPWPVGVFLRKHDRHCGRDLSTGDRVLVYEFRGGPSLLTPHGEKLARCRGSCAVVALATVASKPDRVRVKSEQYLRREPIVWIEIAKLRIRRTPVSPVSREDLVRVMGWSPRYNLRGMGPRSSGLKQLTSEQFREIHGLLRGEAL
jgi:hypothetical protein